MMGDVRLALSLLLFCAWVIGARFVLNGASYPTNLCVYAVVAFVLGSWQLVETLLSRCCRDKDAAPVCHESSIEEKNRTAMKCPKCGSDDVTIATMPNGFGSWKCDSCNASGSYPPKRGVRTMKSRVLMLVLLGLCFLSTPSSVQAQCGFTKSYGYSYYTPSYSYQKPYYATPYYYYQPPSYYYAPYYYGSTSSTDQAQLITASVTLELKKDADLREVKQQLRELEKQGLRLPGLGDKPISPLPRNEPEVRPQLPTPKAQSRINTQVDPKWQEAVTGTCIKCHGGPVAAAKGGNFDMSDLASISYEMRLECYQRMSRREMPPDKPLTEAQVDFLTLASDWAFAARQFRHPRQVANKE